MYKNIVFDLGGVVVEFDPHGFLLDRFYDEALEAKVVLTVPAEDAFLAEMDQAALADLLIVSQAEAAMGEALSVSVESAEGAKCERCWKQSPAVGADPAHPTLCPRCASVIAKSADLGTP